MLAAIQNLNHCRILEAKKIDDGSSPVRVIAERIAAKCGREKGAARRSLAGVDIGANAGDLDSIDGVELAVRQERSPDSNILGPRWSAQCGYLPSLNDGLGPGAESRSAPGN